MTATAEVVHPSERAVPSTGHDGAMSAAALDAAPVLEFGSGLPGFPDAHRFRLESLDELGTLFALRSLEHEGLRFLLVDPGSFFPGYAVEVDDDSAAKLGLSSAADALILLVVTPGTGIDTATANLLAPVVVNQGSGVAAQLVLNSPDLPVAAPLVPRD